MGGQADVGKLAQRKNLFGLAVIVKDKFVLRINIRQDGEVS